MRDQPDFRKRNVNDFRKFLETKILSPAHHLSTLADFPIKFVEFDDEDWTPEDYPDRLADVLVAHFEGNELQEVMISSDDYSD